jgi:hypothetical protein
MAIGQKAESRKKYNDLNGAKATPEFPLYLLTIGPARAVWTMSTVADKSLVELMPIFDSQEQADSLLENLQDRSCQTLTASLSKLHKLVEGRNVLFMLNPKAAMRGGQPYFKEGPNWRLTMDQLSSLIDPTVKK